MITRHISRLFSLYPPVLLAFALQFSCAAEPNGVIIELSPDVVSSLDGTMHVRAMVVEDRAPLDSRSVQLSVDYTDRNGVAHTIATESGTTDKNGVYEATLSGFAWDGYGTVTATLVDGGGAAVLDSAGAPIASSATFSVLDRTPPTLTILPPTTDLRVGVGFPFDALVQVEDEIGISEVIIEAAGEIDRSRSSVVASGATSSTVTFEFDVPNNARPGPTITLYALAVDLSGNIAAATPVVLTVDPAIAIAVPEGLEGSILSQGNGQFLDNPRALAMSPRDGMLYVADNSGNAPCNGGCIRKVDPASGTVVGGVVALANGTLEGIAFDLAGDNLYYSDRQNRVVRLTYEPTDGSYGGAVACNDVANQDPQDPYHLIHDATLGILVVDRQDRAVKQLGNGCDGSPSTDYTNGNFPDRPWGIVMGPSGELYVSDEGADRIYTVEADGTIRFFENRNVDQPRGLAWLSGGPTSFADSLLIANKGNGRVLSSTADDTARSAVYLRNDPVDLVLDNGTLYILTEPSANNPGRIFKVAGF